MVTIETIKVDKYIMKLNIFFNKKSSKRKYLKYVIKIIAVIIVFLNINLIYADMACDNYDNYSYRNGVANSSTTATTFSINKKNRYKYAPDKAFDDKLSTSWVVNFKGGGIGESLILYHNGSINSILIVPGFGIKKYFKKNNRVKELIVTVFNVAESLPHQCNTSYKVGKIVYKTKSYFQDKMKWQSIKLNKNLPANEYLIKFTINDIYEGTKWDETCIAEIKIK